MPHGSDLTDADIAAALPAAGDELERCRALWQKKFGSLIRKK